jgi:hypothetical protein
MTTLPLDPARLTTIVAGEAYAATDQQGNPVETKDGTPQWVVPVLITGERQRPEMVRIKTASPEAPKVAAGQTVKCHGLVAFVWELNGRHGVAYRADRIEPVRAS